MATVNDYVVNELLTELVLAYKNDEYLHGFILPTLNVKKKSGTYYKFNGSNLREVETKRAPGQAANRVEHGLEKITYGPIQEHSLSEGVDIETAEEIGEQEAKQDASETVAELLEVKQERTLAANLADVAIVTQNATLTGADRWDAPTTSDPVADFTTAKNTIVAACGRIPNTAWMSYEVFSYLQNHPKILSRINGVVTQASVEDLQRILGIQTIKVSHAIYNTSVEPAADSFDFIWGKHCFLAYISPRAEKTRRTLTLGHTLRVEGEDDKTIIDEMWDGKHKEWDVRGTTRFEQKFMATECVYAIRTVIS